MHDLRLRLFGGPTLGGAGDGVQPLTPTQESLLALVWGHGSRGIARSRAIWLLWEEEDGPRGRHRLRQLLHELGARVGFRPFRVDGNDTLRPDPEALPSDLDAFTAALRDGVLRNALDLQGEGFASGLHRIPGDAFEDWLQAKRIRLRRDLQNAAAARWDLHHDRGAWPEARDAAEVLFALEPTDVSLRRLMEARAATGQLGLAEAAFAEFAGASNGDTRPSKETLELLERIQHMGSPGVSGANRSSEQPPMVGRRRELASALTVLEKVQGDAFVFLMIQGEAGVGKTRLFDEVLREAHLKGYRCLEARPAELERHIPLNPLVDMASHPDIGPHIVAMEDPWRAVVASLLPTIPDGMDPPVVPYISETSLSRRLYDAFTLLLTRLASEQPTLLFIDDLQWADDTTVAVLQFAQRRWNAGALGIVTTVRVDQPRGSGSGGVATYLNESRDLPVNSIVLEDLKKDDAIRLVDLVAEGTLDRDTCARLCALGGRNPFYLIELTKDYLAERVQLPELPTDTLLIPISLRQLVDPRLAGLTPEASATADYLSVWGRWAPLGGLAALLDVTLDDCTHYVDELERARLVTVERGAVALAHQLFRGAIYHGMTNARRALLHRSLAEYLTTSVEPLPSELAVHFAQAGEAPSAAKHGRVAADKALENGAVAEAAHFLQLVIENEKSDRLKAEATGDLARVLHLNREILRANPLLELAATRLRAVGNQARALRMEVRRVEGLAEVGATPMSELLDRLAAIKAAARAASDDEALTFALDHELHLLHRSGRVEEVPELFGEIRECRESPNPIARCQANASLALNVLFGDGEEGLKCAREAVAIADKEKLDDHSLLALNRLILALVSRGLMNLDNHPRLFERAEELAAKSGDRELRFHLYSNRGVFFLDSGATDEAQAWFNKAGALVSSAEATFLRFTNSFNLGELALARRDYAEARRHFMTAEALLSARMPGFCRALVSAGIGLSALELGAMSEARQREPEVGIIAGDWYFDPTIALRFSARFLERRNRSADGIALLESHRPALARRFPCAWLRLTLVQARMCRRHGTLSTMIASLEDARALADTLALPHLASEIDTALTAPS